MVWYRIGMPMLPVGQITMVIFSCCFFTYNFHRHVLITDLSAFMGKLTSRNFKTVLNHVEQHKEDIACGRIDVNTPNPQQIYWMLRLLRIYNVTDENVQQIMSKVGADASALNAFRTECRNDSLKKMVTQFIHIAIIPRQSKRNQFNLTNERRSPPCVSGS